MSSKAGKGEAWDADIPRKLVPIPNEQYAVKIESLEYVQGQYGRKNLVIQTDQGGIQTGAWNVINFLRKNKPVIGRTLKFIVTGEGIARRFTNLEIE